MSPYAPSLLIGPASGVGEAGSSLLSPDAPSRFTFGDGKVSCSSVVRPFQWDSDSIGFCSSVCGSSLVKSKDRMNKPVEIAIVCP